MVVSVLFPKKHKSPQSLVLWGSLGKAPLKKVAPEVGLEFTYGMMKIMRLRKLLKNLTKI